ncbi:MAG: hypothetical protein JG776_463 [Caloramator sp.]|jgi:hypothetical protein|uniref:hypothetical protein n=1 Tax=Caloramator sp. TaxID=1871330 RepID=UPI001DE13BFA|nr:hypothetical protein [Caloramator sp.]MBZ4662781.1 hypothetical protein [Caloramator sp.]
MKFPDKIKIGGIMLEVILDKHLASAEDKFGECDRMRGRIVIDETQPNDHKEVTLIHEIIEVINGEYELDLEHRQITSLASCLYQVFKDNKISFE